MYEVKRLTREDIPFKVYIRSRFVTPKEFISGITNPVVKPKSLGAILFNARYNDGKAIEGYDFW